MFRNTSTPCPPNTHTYDLKVKVLDFDNVKQMFMVRFLAHLSTRCSERAVVIVLCPSSTFWLVYALEVTFSVRYS